MNTPKPSDALSGIGDQTELQRLGIPVVQHLQVLVRIFQDHFSVGCVWEYQQPLPIRNNGGEATFFWKSDPKLDTPDMQTCRFKYRSAVRKAAANSHHQPAPGG